MTREFETLYANHTWDLVPLSAGKRAIGCKWVYKVKHKADGTVERLNAILVVKSYTQQASVDYTETFSPVIKMTTVRALIGTTVMKGWEMYQLDVNSFSMEIYMRRKKGNSVVFVAVYVDDVILTGTDTEEIFSLKGS
ncbi:uncharacterized mitochondrial protein AtMg00820-like [Nicotiana tomentosiformis]|uniref:uncharacterized mitochondrial protein AtMg00820-like n=1 Tax=Nicotiana tomentosiformis TaxID=4098 RepID=UPI000877F094